MATLGPITYDPNEAKAWLESLMQYKSTNILKTVETPPIPPCPVTHPGSTSELVGSTLVYGYVKNDIDYLFYVNTLRYPAFYDQLVADGWKIDGNYEGAEFESWRKGSFNLIVTTDFVWYKKFAAAAQLCKKLVITDKVQRIAVHEAMLKDYDTE